MGAPEEANDPENGNKSPVANLDSTQQQQTSNGNTKLFLGVIFVVAVAIIAVVVSVLLLNKGEESTADPVSPLKNSAEICDVIAKGGSVPNQDTMIPKLYEITMDVSLTSDLLDPAKVVEELESQMQMKLGPKFADCPGSRRLREGEVPKESRELLDKHIVGNALFDLKHVIGASCKDGAPTPCIVVDATMTLYLKEEQNMLSVLRSISSLMEETAMKDSLDLSDDGPVAHITVTDLDDGTLSPTPAPSSSPPPTKTPLYPPNTSDDCAAISNGDPVATQELLIIRTFDIRMDIFLTLQLSDLSEVVEEMESRMQRVLGPELGDCMARGDSAGFSIERNVIGNALFEVVYQEDESCDNAAPTPCFRALTKLTVMLKGEEDTLPLANRITEVIASASLTDVLGLTAPFYVIEVVGVTASIPTIAPTSSPTAFSIYEANSPEVCDNISSKDPVPNQDGMILTSFDVRFEVSLTLQLSAVIEVVKEMDKRIQQYISPKLADCGGYRRSLSNVDDRKLLGSPLERNVVGNAQFFLEYQPDQNCDYSAPTPMCIRVLGQLNLYTKAAQYALPLANHISSILGSEDLMSAMDLSAPFAKIEVIGITTSVPFVPGPSLAPTPIKFVPGPTMAPTPIPDSSPPDSSEVCNTMIAFGLPVPDQDLMIPLVFDIEMSVLLTFQLSDLSEVVEEIESRMQRILAPALAGCPAARRLGESGVGARRELVDDLMIGNAQFQLVHRESEACSQITSPLCIRVDARLNMFLKQEARTFEVITKIADLMSGQDKALVDVLGLTAPFDDIQFDTIRSVDTTLSPTSAPTEPSLFDSNTPEECTAISLGEPMPLQDEMMSMTFNIFLDVSLTLQLSDLTEVVEEMEYRMQQILGPRFADCEGSRRLQEGDIGEHHPSTTITRHLLERHVVANALFNAVYQEDQTCDNSAPAPCIRALAKLTLWLKGEEKILSLMSRIVEVVASSPLTDVLGLTAPFNVIEIVSVDLSQ